VTPLGGCTLNLGHIPQFGETLRPVQYCPATVVDGSMIEVVLPWADKAAGHGEPASVAAPPPAKPIKLCPKLVSDDKPPVAAVAARSISAGSCDADDDTISVTVGRQDGSISYRGQTIKLTVRCARLAQAMRAAYPSPVDRPFVSRKVFDNATGHSIEALESVRSALNDAIRPIGLDVRYLRGIGLQLVKVESPT
jgi:hypothetical protein